MQFKKFGVATRLSALKGLFVVSLLLGFSQQALAYPNNGTTIMNYTFGACGTDTNYINLTSSGGCADCHIANGTAAPTPSVSAPE